VLTYGKGIPYILKGKAIGTVSNLEGHFSFENASVSKMIIFTFE
jgi:hypothetical protein